MKKNYFFLGKKERKVSKVLLQELQALARRSRGRVL